MSKAVEPARDTVKDMVSGTPPSPAVVQTLSSAALLAKVSCRKALDTLTGMPPAPAPSIARVEAQRRWREWGMRQGWADSADAAVATTGPAPSVAEKSGTPPAPVTPNATAEASTSPSSPTEKPATPLATALPQKLRKSPLQPVCDGLSFLGNLKTDMDVKKEAAIEKLKPVGATAYSMATYELVDSGSGRKTTWRLYGVSRQAIQIGQFVFANRAMRERPFPESENILARDMVVYRWHDQFSARVGYEIGKQGAMVCYACQFVNTTKPSSAEAMIEGRLEGPKMLLMYLLDSGDVKLIPDQRD